MSLSEVAVYCRNFIKFDYKDLEIVNFLDSNCIQFLICIRLNEYKNVALSSNKALWLLN